MTDRDKLLDLLGQWVTVTNPRRPAAWYGKLVALADDPSVLIQTPGQGQGCFPQSFIVEAAEPPLDQTDDDEMRHAAIYAEKLQATAFTAIEPALENQGEYLPIGARQAVAGAVLKAVYRDIAAASARVRDLHQQYRSAGDDTTDYCAHCNQISGGWIPWPCPTLAALNPPKEQQ